MNTHQYDIAIIGGGLAGLSAAILFGQYGFQTLCLDAQSREQALKPSADGRTTAISYGSHLLFRTAGVWPLIEDHACPIDRIDIKDGSTPTLLPFLNEDVEGKSFGWVVDNQILRQALFDRASQVEGLTHICGQAFETMHTGPEHININETYTAKLLIGADGRGSKVRDALGIDVVKKDYGQVAAVFIAYHENPHHNLGVEHFRENGPFAILPMLDNKTCHRSCVVWSDHGEGFPDDQDIFLRAVQERFPHQYGAVTALGSISKWPLTYQHAKRYIGTRTALIAEAAHAMHPIAGQGLNMSLRDAAAIVELCVEARGHNQDLGGADVLNRYEAWRRSDNRNMIWATDGLNSLFSNTMPAMRSARNLGLEIVRKTPVFRKFFMKQAMGQMGNLPKLIKGEDLAA